MSLPISFIQFNIVTMGSTDDNKVSVHVVGNCIAVPEDGVIKVTANTDKALSIPAQAKKEININTGITILGPNCFAYLLIIDKSLASKGVQLLGSPILVGPGVVEPLDVVLINHSSGAVEIAKPDILFNFLPLAVPVVDNISVVQ